MFDFIAYPLANVILLLYNLLGQQTVLAITALTILLNLILFPLTQGQQKSASQNARAPPELDKLKKKHGNDKERMQQEQMKLYREMGVNPMGGCLPLPDPDAYLVWAVPGNPILHSFDAAGSVPVFSAYLQMVAGC